MHHIYICIRITMAFQRLREVHFLSPYPALFHPFRFNLSFTLSLSFIRSLSLSFKYAFSPSHIHSFSFSSFFFLFIHLLLLDSLHSSSFPHTNWYYSLVTTLFLLFPLFTSIIFPLFSRFILPSCSVYRSTLVRAQLLKRRRRAIFHFSISWFVPSFFFLFVSILLTVITEKEQYFWKGTAPKKKKKKKRRRRSTEGTKFAKFFSLVLHSFFFSF